MSESLPYDEIEFDKNFKIEDMLYTIDDSDFGYFFQFDLKNPDEEKNKTRNFPFAPQKNLILIILHHI